MCRTLSLLQRSGCLEFSKGSGGARTYDSKSYQCSLGITCASSPNARVPNLSFSQEICKFSGKFGHLISWRICALWVPNPLFWGEICAAWVPRFFCQKSVHIPNPSFSLEICAHPKPQFFFSGSFCAPCAHNLSFLNKLVRLESKSRFLSCKICAPWVFPGNLMYSESQILVSLGDLCTRCQTCVVESQISVYRRPGV